MKQRIYHREETDTFDEINKVLNELRDEITSEFALELNQIGELEVKVKKLERKVKELAPAPEEVTTPPIPKKKRPSAKNKKK